MKFIGEIFLLTMFVFAAIIVIGALLGVNVIHIYVQIASRIAGQL
jgi:hypothetical protein